MRNCWFVFIAVLAMAASAAVASASLSIELSPGYLGNHQPGAYPPGNITITSQDEPISRSSVLKLYVDGTEKKSEAIGADASLATSVKRKQYFNFTINASGFLEKWFPISFEYTVRASTPSGPVTAGPVKGVVSNGDGMKFIKDFSYMAGSRSWETTSVNDSMVGVWMLAACSGEEYENCTRSSGKKCTTDSKGMITSRLIAPAEWITPPQTSYVELSSSRYGYAVADAVKFVSGSGTEFIVDNSGQGFAAVSGNWLLNDSGGYMGDHMYVINYQQTATAIWKPDLPTSRDMYSVYVRWTNNEHPAGEARSACGDSACPQDCDTNYAACEEQDCELSVPGVYGLYEKKRLFTDWNSDYGMPCDKQNYNLLRCPTGFVKYDCGMEPLGPGIFYLVRTCISPCGETAPETPDGWKHKGNRNCGRMETFHYKNCSWPGMEKVNYKVVYEGGSETIELDQEQDDDQWVYLGTYPFIGGGFVMREARIEPFSLNAGPGFPGADSAGIFLCAGGQPCDYVYNGACCGRLGPGMLETDGAGGKIRLVKVYEPGTYVINYAIPNGPRACAYTTYSNGETTPWSGVSPLMAGGQQFVLYGGAYTANYSAAAMRALFTPGPNVTSYSLDEVQGNVSISMRPDGGGYSLRATTAVNEFSSSLILPLEKFQVAAPSTGSNHTLMVSLFRNANDTTAAGSEFSGFLTCTDADADGYCLQSVDCDDTKAGVYPGAAEICDSLDNDCDMQVDEDCRCPEGVKRPCPGGKSEGECEIGFQECSDGVWGECEGRVNSRAEKCNGKDDDCDGQVDEGFDCVLGETKRCGVTMGICAEGTVKCTSRCDWSNKCEGETRGLPDELCGNTEDDDCDGQMDESDCLLDTDTLCMNGPIDASCRCGNSTYRTGFCCENVYMRAPCPSLIPGLPASLWNLLVLVGIVMMVGAGVVYLYMKSKFTGSIDYHIKRDHR